MELHEVESRINSLEDDIANIKYDNTQLIGFIIGFLNITDSDNLLTDYSFYTRCPTVIQEYIIKNYEKVNSTIVAQILESKSYYPSGIPTLPIFRDPNYFSHILKNPNLSIWDKKEIKKRESKYNRDLKKRMDQS
jgi:hypothetical protein